MAAPRGIVRVSGLHGGLELVAAADASGATFLRRQSFAPPVHISKPHQDGSWLVVNLASPSPGLLAGDRVESSVAVESGAHLLLTAPSASRVHRMVEGYAEVNQLVHIAAGGFLEYWPEYLIPQAGARYRQHNNIHVADGGSLMWIESIAPGRTAMGEAFQFEELRLWTDVTVGQQQLVRERYALRADNLGGLRKKFPTAYYGSIICVGSETAEASLRELMSEHASPAVWVGATRLAQHALVVKIVAADSPTLRRVIEKVRTQLHCLIGVRGADLRRTTAAV